jgi:endoglucanase
MQALARHLAGKWSPRQLALQLMTEPFGCSEDTSDWNAWDRLQRRIWQAIRREMPRHTLILSGDRVGTIEGFDDIEPVDDDNVLYAFSFYEPAVFTQQGGPWIPGGMPYLKALPYPSGPAILAELPRILSAVPAEWLAEVRARVELYASERWDREKLAQRIAKLVAWRERHGGRPRLWCGEFGCYQAAAPADRCLWLSDVRELLEQNRIGWAYWSYNEAFTVMTPDRTPFGPAAAQKPDPAVLRALLPGR